MPGRVVKAVDATGAGDCFGGAFIARIVAGRRPVRQAARYANVAAALSDAGLRRGRADSSIARRWKRRLRAQQAGRNRRGDRADSWPDR